MTDWKPKVRISPYLHDLIASTGGPAGPIGRQFVPCTNATGAPKTGSTETEADPQDEVRYEVAPGMIYKYRGEVSGEQQVLRHGRVLWTISRYCVAYCQFCFRGRFVGLKGTECGPTADTLAQKALLDQEDIETGLDYIRQHCEINEVILSGGDPLVTPKSYLNKILEGLEKQQLSGAVEIVRVHTRAPITDPRHIKDGQIEALGRIKNPYLVLHINHPWEVTTEVVEVVEKLRQSGVILLSQSVLLRGVNDKVEILCELFAKLVRNGIVPYYLHQNDPVSWAQHFTVPFAEAVQLWRSLRPRLSGLAGSVKFVIDTPHGTGKVVVPEAGWKVDDSRYWDFEGKEMKIPS
jgi:lysine 2,3-aminomutase